MAHSRQFSSQKKRKWMMRLPVGAEKILSVFLVLLDAVSMNAIFIWVFHIWLTETPQQSLYLASYFNSRWWLFGFYLFFGFLAGIFNIRTFKAASDIFSHTTNALLGTFVSFNLLVFFWRGLALQTHTFPRSIFLLATGLSIVAIFVQRAIISGILKPYPLLKKAIIIGNELEGKRIVKHFHRRGGVRFRIAKVMKSEEIDNLASETIFHHASEIFVTDPSLNLDQFWAQIFYDRKVEPHDFKVRVVYDPKLAAGRMGLESLEDFPLTTIKALPLNKLQSFVKRAFDIIFATFAIIVSSPAMIIAAILVRLDSKGPIFYSQKRVGQYGEEFDVIKFRSMRVGAESKGGPQIATADDPRTTKLGKYMRRFGIDELPQFFLVLTGDMSVVGPRPERPYFVKSCHDFQGRRLSMKPGVTGLAAVNSRYYLRLVDKVGYDYFYLDNYSLILDIKIVFQTVWVLVFESNKALHDRKHVLDEAKTVDKDININEEKS